MKKIFTLFALSSLIFLTILNVPAQKTRKTSIFKQSSRQTVEINRSEAFSDGNGVWLSWNTSFENKNLGFNIYRTTGGEFVPVNQNIIPATHLRLPEQAGSAGQYTFFDPAGRVDATYYIESIGLDGRKRSFSPIFPQSVHDLTPIAGVSSDFLQRANADARPEVINSELVIPEDVKANLETTGDPLADPGKQKWVAGQPGVKIGVRQEGIYRVTRDQLEAAGFNVNSSPELWQLYSNGVEQAIIVAPGGNYIEFYGKGIDTFETDTHNYFLLVGENNGKRMGTRTGRTIASPVAAPSYNHTFIKKERITYFSGIFNGHEENFYGSLITSSGVNINFNLTGLTNHANISVVVTLMGLTFNNHHVRVRVNGTETALMQGFNRNKMEKEFFVPSSLLNEGSNTLQLSTQSSGDITLFDKIQVTYPRAYLAEQNQLSFYTNNYRASNLTGFTSPNIRVFDISNPNSPDVMANLNVAPDGNNYRVKIPAHRGRIMFAAANEAVKQPSSITQNIASTLSGAAHNGKLVIIKHKNFLAEATEWANYRKNQGTSVEVIDIEDIFDEFNFGNLGASAIRNFLQFAKNNWQTPPEYVLIIGDASYDSRNYTGNGNWNMVPTKMVDTLYSETGSDDSLTDFNDDGLAEIPIGRIPARTGANVLLVLNKVKTFEQNAARAIDRGALCVSDLPEGYDFTALCNRVFNELPTNVNKSFLNRGDNDAHNQLITTLNTGKYLVNYSGHGSVSAWSSASSFFNGNHANQLTNNDLSIFTMLTCLNGYYIEPSSNSLSENGLFAPNGGAVSTWASSGLTTPDVQEIMAKRFYKQIGEGNLTRLGNLINDAKSIIPGGRDVRLSWALLGDPMLKVR